MLLTLGFMLVLQIISETNGQPGRSFVVTAIYILYTFSYSFILYINHIFLLVNYEKNTVEITITFGEYQRPRTLFVETNLHKQKTNISVFVTSVVTDLFSSPCYLI